MEGVLRAFGGFLSNEKIAPFACLGKELFWRRFQAFLWWWALAIDQL